MARARFSGIPLSVLLTVKQGSPSKALLWRPIQGGIPPIEDLSNESNHPRSDTTEPKGVVDHEMDENMKVGKPRAKGTSLSDITKENGRKNKHGKTIINMNTESNKGVSFSTGKKKWQPLAVPRDRRTTRFLKRGSKSE